MASNSRPERPETVEPLLHFEKDLFEEGRQRALASGATKINEDELVPLERHAEAMARRLFRERFDPETNTNDALRAKEQEKVVAERAELEQRRPYAEANLREMRDGKARLPEPGTEPCVPLFYIVAAMTAIAASIAPTVHDRLPDLDDGLLVWFFAVIAGLLVAASIVWPIARMIDGRDSSKPAWGGLFAGGVVGLGILIVRLAAAEDASEVPVAVGLAILELGAVVGLEFAAKAKRRLHAEWRKRSDDIGIADKEEAAAEQELRRIDERLALLASQSKAFLDYIEERTLRNMSAEQIVAAAVQAVRDGYAAGVAQNRGRLLGITRRPS